MKTNRLALALALSLVPAAHAADRTSGLDPALLTRPPTDSWPTYHGDYSGRRYSTLGQINADNVKGLSLAWVYRLNTSPGGAVVIGEGPETPPPGSGGFGLDIKSTPLLVNGVLYLTAPDNVWALDPRTGRENWHFYWMPPRVGMYGNWLYF